MQVFATGALGYQAVSEAAVRTDPVVFGGIRNLTSSMVQVAGFRS